MKRGSILLLKICHDYLLGHSDFWRSQWYKKNFFISSKFIHKNKNLQRSKTFFLNYFNKIFVESLINFVKAQLLDTGLETTRKLENLKLDRGGWRNFIHDSRKQDPPSVKSSKSKLDLKNCNLVSKKWWFKCMLSYETTE